MITDSTPLRAAPVLRRLRQLPSEPSGLEAQIKADPDALWAKSLRAFLEGRQPRPVERWRTGLTEEVDEVFREAQRMPRGRR